MIGPQEDDCQRDTIVLAHGLGGRPLLMRPMARWLEQHFKRVINWGYPSLWSPIESHGKEFAGLLRQLDDDEAYGRIHLVGHSMGGIIARLALAEYLPRRLGRFVMIAPPNRGSRVARRLAPHLGRFIPPITQLTDDTAGFVCTLPQPTAPELGIIAAELDFMVPEDNTRLGCECDHIVLPGLHSTLLWRQETAEQVRHFLETGKFYRVTSST
ncbi:MAG TPA: alpha/beta hydrolase [Pirellulaceae bacterium]|jgi:pimeloyl-ACP methyl ester carboxylesterase